MSESRDIDEILASLDALLREGSTPKKAVAVNTEAIIAASDESEGVEAALLSEGTVKPEPIVEASDARTRRVLLTKDMLVESPQVVTPEESIAENKAKEVRATILQETDIKEVLSKQTTDNKIIQTVTSTEPVLHLQAKDVERLLSLVSRDISNHLQKNLPKLIHKSLHAHLAAMQVSTQTQKKHNKE